MLNQCPIGKISNEQGQVYSLLKQTLLSEFGCACTPSVLLEEMNVLFVYIDTINKAESDFNIEGN